MQLLKWTTCRLKSCRNWVVLAPVLFILFDAPFARSEPWSYHAGRLASLSTQIKGVERSILDMIDQKNKTEDPEQVKDLLESLTSQYGELKRLSKEYEEERLHIRFKHPDRNEAADRQYVRYRLKTLEEMEHAMGLEGRLDRIKARVTVIFPAPPRSQPAPEPSKARLDLLRGPASIEESELPERVRLVK